MASSIRLEVDRLPERGVTVYALNALDFIVPGEWTNPVGFENMVRDITGETDPARIRKIAQKAVDIYNQSGNGYQRALWIYQVVDRADAALGAAAMADKVGEKISFLSFLSRLTPKADTTQTIDLAVKVAAELIAFCQIQGIPRDFSSINTFVGKLGDYGGESLMRMVAIICLDGLIPLGPDFLRNGANILENLSTSDLEQNPVFKRAGELIPGDGTGGQLKFITESFEGVQDWMGGFIDARNINVDKVVGSLHNYINFTDDKLDYVAAFLDMSTNYFAHTGTQSLAHHLIDRAATEV